MTLRLLHDAPSALDAFHYLGEIGGKRYTDEHGIVVIGRPSSRMLPASWVELKRWCLLRPSQANAGARQWARVKRWIAEQHPETTTVVSYSDPSVGHDGALYRACGWLWAPTWQRLRPPPTGGGSWDGKTKSEPKDRWVFPLREDSTRASVLAVCDESIVRRMPWASYQEPTWRRGVPRGGGADFARWKRGAP
jgi:hypothetical protein